MGVEKEKVKPISLWGGVEATVNRVGCRFNNQLQWNGHADRPEDFDLFAGLGLEALRLPILWETTMPEGPASADWRYADQAMERLRELKIQPIVGLCHHGSGPAHTSLIEQDFPEKLAIYARLVAERFSEAGMYTPVNEPLTTARFSALYGHWYPHAQDNFSFVNALLNQVRGTVLAMRAIRDINPAAKLVQTDDLGKTYATPKLAYQAEFENERRWLSWDLLCGRVDRQHPLWDRMLYMGATEEQLNWHLDNRCLPDVIGINHYVSSERFLDDRLHLHVPNDIGGNDRDIYADVLAARVREEGCGGFLGVMREAWDRYKIPVAITECHMGCTREEQLRWVAQAWNEAHTARDEGVEVVGFTLWSLIGSFDWNSLLTRNEGHYEPGVFDLRSPFPRPTAIARMAKAMAKGKKIDHPVLDTPGWWKRPSRLRHDPVADNGACPGRPVDFRVAGRPILIAGANGSLARAIAAECEHRGLAYRALSRNEMDIAEPTSVERAVEEHLPWAIINAAGYQRVEEADRDVERCFRENATGPAVLAEICSERQLPLVCFSSGLVFSGDQKAPYLENDKANPTSTYGKSKFEGEKCALLIHRESLVVRTSALFGVDRLSSFPQHVFRTLAAGGEVIASDDVVCSLTFIPDLVHAVLDLLIDGERGILHLANKGELSQFELAREIARRAGFDQNRVKAMPSNSPTYCALMSNRGWVMPTLENALDRFVEEMRQMQLTRPQFAFIS